MHYLFLDYTEILRNTILAQDLKMLNEVLDYHKQTNTSFSLLLEVQKSERLQAEYLIVSFLKSFKGSLSLFIDEPVSNRLVGYFGKVNKEFKPYQGIMLNSLIAKVSNPTMQNKLKEFFRNVLQQKSSKNF